MIKIVNDLHGHAIIPDRSFTIDISRTPTENKIIFSTVVKWSSADSKHYPYIQKGHIVGVVIGYVKKTPPYLHINGKHTNAA